MIEYRDIGYDWDFSEEEANILVNYLYATQLLLDCLDVAVVTTDRAALRDRLLRPPEGAG
jgi:hypothetical protein